MAERILVSNAISTEAVTRGIEQAVEPLRMPGRPAIECVTIKAGAPGRRRRHGLRRHGALPQAAPGRDRHPGGRADASGGGDGDRSRAARLELIQKMVTVTI